MAGQERASIFGDELDGLGESAWTPEAEKPKRPRPRPADVQESAKAAGFKSREPAPVAEASPPPKQRRWRTGRNVQFNVRATQETIDAFTAIADANGWSLGETFEKATNLLLQHCDINHRR